MNILITGGNGQLGSELTRILENNHSELGSIPACYEGARVTQIDLDMLDISDSKAVTAYLQPGEFELVINCAAITNVDGCETNPELAMKVNAIGARNLARAAQESGSKFLHVSTDYVFSGNGSEPYTEWDTCAPQSVYGKSKWLGEEFVREQCTRYFIVRTAWLYGYVGKNFVKTIMKVARANGQLKVVNDQRGNPTNAADLAHHILKIAATEQYGIYHCTGNGECSWYDFACKIVEYAGIPCTTIPCTTEEFLRPAKRPFYSSLGHMMLRCTVGDEMRDWQIALQYFMQNYREREG